MNPMLSVLGLSGSELLIVLFVLISMAVVGGGVLVLCVWLISRNSRRAATPPVAPPTSAPRTSPASAPTSGGAATKRVCPRCGADIESGAPQGLCPRCLMQAGIESQFGEPAKPSHPAPEPKDIAQFFPQLEILETLGQGGMGVVYKARQPQLDRLVALKILSPEMSRDPAFAERFSREAKALARLNHPNIVAVFDSGQAGEFYYLIMEYVDGVNLWQMEQTRKRLAPEEALAIVPKICDALQYAHDEGIVHRDIKPANILVDTKGRVKIADFGLAKLLGKESQLGLTQSRATMGTPQYMAPEQIEKPLLVDHRADIYSLGVVFYEMLTGELPLGRFSPPSAKVRMDVRLDEVVLRTLEKEPERRYQQASQVKSDVETIVTNSGAMSASSPVPGSAGGGSDSGASSRPGSAFASASVAPERQVVAPAIALMVLGVLQFIPAIFLALFLLTEILKFDPVRSGFPPGARFSEVVLLWIPCLMLIPGVVTIIAGNRMRKLRSYSLAIAAGVIAILLPPFNLLLLGLGIGVWSLVVLLRPEVRDAFAVRAGGVPAGKVDPKVAPGIIAGTLVALGTPIICALLFVSFIFGMKAHIGRPRMVENQAVHVDTVTFLYGQNCCINNSGETVAAPAPLPDDDSARTNTLEQLRQTGGLSDIDIVANPAARSLTFIDCIVAPITNEEFDNALDQTAQNQFSGGQPVLTLPITNTPATFLFQNKQGNRGAIQVIALGEKNMNVRCKLVK